MRLSGIVPAIGTPLAEGDRVDEAGLRRLVQYLLGGGVHGIFSNGSMGGFAFLTDDEQIRSIRTTVSEVNGRVPVLAGLGETSTSRAVRMAKRIAAEGVDALCALPPFFFFATQQHLIAYFSEIAAAVDIPLVLYDNPGLTKNGLEPDTIAELMHRIPTLAGIKVSDERMTKLQDVLHVTSGRDDFFVFTGSEFLILAALQAGCHGGVGGLHNLCPHMAVALWDAWQRHDLDSARKLQRDLIETWQLFRHGSIWGAFDEALRYLGICQRATGAPYVTAMDEAGRKAVRSILDQYVKPYLAASATV